MFILGLCGSYRKLGNSEVLVKEALAAVKREGAETKFLRLTDYEIKQCKGCLACVFKKEECKIPDDWMKLKNLVLKADGLIVSAPTYFLGPPGIIKLIIDRNISLYGKLIEINRKPAGVIGVAGVKGWAPFTLPLLNLFVLTFGFEAVDQFLTYAQGPGEVVLNEENLERARKLGLNVYYSIKNHDLMFKGERNICPVCHQNIFAVKTGKILECSLCQVKLNFETSGGEMKLVYSEENLNENRWGAEKLAEHFFQAILPSFSRYRKNIKEIKEKCRKYLSF